MASSNLSLLINVFAVVSCAMAALPGGLKSCKMSSADYSKCLATQTTNAIAFFKDGNKKLGVDSIDPFMFEKLTVDQGTGPVAINLQFKDLSLLGISTLTVTDIKNDWKTLVLKVNIPKSTILAEYTISGKVLVLPIAGTGKSNITFSDLDATVTLHFKELSQNGKSYIQAKAVECIISPKRTYFNLENLFNGDKALGDNMNLFLNENHDQIINELQPAISRSLSEGFGKVTNQILAKMSLNEIVVK